MRGYFIYLPSFLLRRALGNRSSHPHYTHSHPSTTKQKLLQRLCVCVWVGWIIKWDNHKDRGEHHNHVYLYVCVGCCSNDTETSIYMEAGVVFFPPTSKALMIYHPSVVFLEAPPHAYRVDTLYCMCGSLGTIASLTHFNPTVPDTLVLSLSLSKLPC